MNNPLRFIDPDGMKAQRVKGADGNWHEVSEDDGIDVYNAPAEDDKDKGKKVSTGRGGGDDGTPFNPPTHLQASSLQNASISQTPSDNFTPDEKAAQVGVNIAGAVEGGYSFLKGGLALLKNGFSGLKALFGLSKNQISVEGIISNFLRTQKQVNEHIIGGVSLGKNSYLNSVDDAKSVLNAAHNGDAIVLSINETQNRAYVLYKDVTGYYNNNGIIIETNKFLIKGGKSATVVPIHPNSTTFK